MKCAACDKTLSDRELGKKDGYGNHLDLCSECYEPYRETLLTIDEVIEGRLVEIKVPLEDTF